MSNVKAAYAYAWNIDGEDLWRGKSNSSGSAIWKEDEVYTGGVLTLNNYDGGQISISCRGTGLPNQVFAIKLVGNNKITVKDDAGIINDAGEIVFIGDGTLEIVSPIPISGYSFGYTPNIVSNIDIPDNKLRGSATTKINPSNECNVNTDKDKVNEDTKGNEQVEDKNKMNEKDGINNINDSEQIEDKTNNVSDNELVDENTKSTNNYNIIDICTIIYCVISFVTIIILIIKLINKNKKLKNNF